MLRSAWLARGGERSGERGGIRSRVSRLRSGGQAEGASLRGAARGQRTRSSAAAAMDESDAGVAASCFARRLRRAPVGRWARHGLSSPPWAPPHVGRRDASSPLPPRLRFSPRMGQAAAFLPGKARAAVRVAQHPPPPSASQRCPALSGAGDRAPLRLLQGSAAPSFPLWRSAHA